MTFEDTKNALADIQGKIAKAEKLASRDNGSTKLIAISKTRTADEIRALLDARHRIFGENRVQEAQEKWPRLREEYPDIKLHLVGQLQSNKAEDAVALFDTIHSLDRVSLVKALAKAMKKLDRYPPCFIQVNIGEEPQKGGCAIGDVADLAKSARDAEIPISGLMCIPPAGVEPSPYFALLSKVAQDNGLAELSMGMSADFESAVKLGATHVRVGTALFGERER